MTGQIKSYDDIPEGDFRKTVPRFKPGNFEVNMKLVAELEKLAKKRSCTPAQLAIGWVRSLSKRDGMPQIFPIPGASSVERVRENSVEIELTQQEMEEIDSILDKFEVVGDRYHEHGMKMIDG